MLIQLSKSLKIGMLIIILMNLFSCHACDENIQDIGRKVKKSGQVLGGLTATQIEPGMLFMYGATHNAPRNLSYPIIGGVMGITAPIHVSRLTSCAAIIQESIEKNNNFLVSTAQLAHSVLNGVFPIVYIGMRTEHNFPLFAAIILPFRASSELIKRMEFNDCIANRTLGQTQHNFQQPIISMILNSALSIPKALMIKSMASNTLSTFGYEDKDGNFAISTSLAVASTALTIAFESDKINILSKRLMQNTVPMLLEGAQAALISTIYYGMGNSELDLPMLAVAGVFALETVVEAVSIDRHWTTVLSPFCGKVRSKVARWLGF